MHREDQGQLPYNNLIKAPAHRLNPPVNAVCDIVDGVVTYIGPTVINIRSAKHESSTTATQ